MDADLAKERALRDQRAAQREAEREAGRPTRLPPKRQPFGGRLRLARSKLGKACDHFTPSDEYERTCATCGRNVLHHGKEGA